MFEGLLLISFEVVAAAVDVLVVTGVVVVLAVTVDAADAVAVSSISAAVSASPLFDLSSTSFKWSKSQNDACVILNWPFQSEHYKTLENKKHSSRMRTVRCSGCLPRGVSAWLGGVCPEGVCPEGVSTWPSGVCLVRGLAAWPGECLPGQECTSLPLVQTNTRESITFPQLLLRIVKIGLKSSFTLSFLAFALAMLKIGMSANS